MLVWWTKALGNLLATETALTKRRQGISAGGDAATCKLCGAAPESNWHMMAECTGCPKVIASRRCMVANVHAVLEEHLPRDAVEAKEALRQMWSVDSAGRLCDWAAIGALEDGYGDAVNAELGHDAILADHLERMRSMRSMMRAQTGPDCAAVGCLSKGWRRLIKIECDMKGGAVLQMLTSMQAAMRGGIRQVWLHRSNARARWAYDNKLTTWQRRDAALEALLRRYKQRDRDVPDGLRMDVLNMKGKRLRKWIALQENQQRCMTEVFTARPKTEADRQRKRRHDSRVTVARLTRQPTARRTQLVLAGTAGAAADGMEAQLAFSRHTPAHALAGGRLQHVEPASAKRQDPCASAHQRNLAPRCLAQV